MLVDKYNEMYVTKLSVDIMQGHIIMLAEDNNSFTCAFL